MLSQLAPSIIIKQAIYHDLKGNAMQRVVGLLLIHKPCLLPLFGDVYLHIMRSSGLKAISDMNSLIMKSMRWLLIRSATTGRMINLLISNPHLYNQRLDEVIRPEEVFLIVIYKNTYLTFDTTTCN